MNSRACGPRPPSSFPARICLAVAVGLALAGPVLVSSPAAALTVNRTVVSMFSDPGDYIGAGESRFYYPGNGTVEIGGDPTYLIVSVSGGTLGDSYSMTFAPPPGQRLRAQVYVGAQRAPFREAGRPGIDIYGDGRGCNELSGRFDVKDIATDASGAVTRLWLTFEQHCEGGVPALFGEVRIAQPDVQASFLMSPQSLWFPDTSVATTSTVVPITVAARKGIASTAIDGVRLRGLHADDYEIRADECTGRTLGPGEICLVFVRFRPSVPGPRVATLTVRDASGGLKRTVLDGVGIGGTTSFTMDSDPGDWIGGGQQRAYSPSNATISAAGSRRFVSARIDGNDGADWTAQFEAPQGDILAAGSTYTDALRYPFNGGATGMSISGDGRGCNTLTGQFTVNDIKVASDGSLLYIGIDYEQHCEGGTAALRGTLEYRVPAGDTERPDPATGLSVVRAGHAATISWTNPGSDFAAAIVRFSRGTKAPGVPDAQQLAYAGTGSSVEISHLMGRRPLSVSVFTVDAAGNVGAAATFVGP